MTWDLLWLALGGAAAGFVNTVAGGGSALTVPLLMMAGLDANAANGTNRVGVLVQAAAATATYHRRAVRPWAIGGALLGAIAATRLPAAATARAFGVVFLVLAVLIVARPRIFEVGDAPPWGPARGRLAMFAVGLYGGVFQAGVGVPLLLVAVRGFGLDAVRGNALKSASVMVYTVLVVAVFGLAGQLDWVAGGALAVGGLVGSVFGARATIRRGAALVRWMVFVALIAAGLKALLG